MTAKTYFDKFYGIDITDSSEDEVQDLILASVVELRSKMKFVASKESKDEQSYYEGILAEVELLGKASLEYEFYEIMPKLHKLHELINDYIKTID